MRITNKIIAKNLLSSISDTKAKMAELQLDIATTKKLRKPSDNVTGILKLERLNEFKAKNEQYLRNISHISGWIDSTSSALDSIADVLMSAKEKAIQAASGTLNDKARESLAKVVDQKIDTLVDLGNTKYNGKFVFGGTKTTNTNPYTRTDDLIEYKGNNSSIKGKIGFNSTVQYNKTGTEVFKQTGQIDIFNVLINLKQALEKNDTTVIQNSIDQLEQATEHVNSISAEFGALQNRLSLTEEILNNENINLTILTSEIEDTDIAKTIINYQTAESAYTASLRTASNLVRTSLVDFLS